MAEALTPDICVIGAGSAGLTVAAAAAALGVSVVQIEKGKMGGDCLNTGCVPSKALLKSAQVAHAMRHADRWALAVADPQPDLAHVMTRVRAVIAEIEPHDQQGHPAGAIPRYRSGIITILERAYRGGDCRTLDQCAG